uniref:Uncharacterized protein n=1 Tax=viral metagenome TaxID=1070528 RepID=A0A6M3KP56_9ZZZZ
MCGYEWLKEHEHDHDDIVAKIEFSGPAGKHVLSGPVQQVVKAMKELRKGGKKNGKTICG